MRADTHSAKRTKGDTQSPLNDVDHNDPHPITSARAELEQTRVAKEEAIDEAFAAYDALRDAVQALQRAQQQEERTTAVIIGDKQRAVDEAERQYNTAKEKRKRARRAFETARLMYTDRLDTYHSKNTVDKNALSIDAKRFVFTRPHQMRPSKLDPERSPLLSGFGFLPQYTQHLPREEIEKLLVPSPEEIAHTPTQEIFTGSVCEVLLFEPVYASEHLGQAGTRECLEPLFTRYGFVSSPGTLCELGIGNGVLTKDRKGDFFYIVNDVVLGVVKVEGTEHSLQMVLREGVGFSSHIALALLDLGLSPEEIFVPCIACNGLCIQFGVTTVLTPSFPSFAVISPVLDLTRQEQAVMAFLDKARACMNATYELLREKRRNTKNTSNVTMTDVHRDSNAKGEKAEMFLDTRQYSLQLLDEDEVEVGLGLFNLNARSCAFDAGLRHMFRALGRLYRSPQAREYVMFPLSLRTPNSSECVYYTEHHSEMHTGMRHYVFSDAFTPMQLEHIERTQKLDYFALVFDNLTKNGFRRGAPNRNTDPALFDEFIRALSTAIAYIHEAGAVHGDLYPSFIFWKAEERDGRRKFSIKLSRWDISHCLDKESFRPHVQMVLSENEGREVRLEPRHDLRYVEALQMPASDASQKRWWTDIASNNCDTINNAFREMFHFYLSRESNSA